MACADVTNKVFSPTVRKRRSVHSSTSILPKDNNYNNNNDNDDDEDDNDDDYERISIAPFRVKNAQLH